MRAALMAAILSLAGSVTAGPAMADPTALPSAAESQGICEALRVDKSISAHSPIIVALTNPNGSWDFICFAIANGLLRSAVHRTVIAE